MTANLQALWAVHEPQMDELTIPFLGAERAGWQYPFAGLQAAGARLCAGSDWPVSSPDPLLAAHVAVNRVLVVYREPVLDMQLIQERIAGVAMELFASTCTLSRWDSELQASQRNGNAASSDSYAPGLFLRRSFRCIRTFLDSLGDNDDKAILATADSVLGKTR